MKLRKQPRQLVERWRTEKEVSCKEATIISESDKKKISFKKVAAAYAADQNWKIG